MTETHLRNPLGQNGSDYDMNVLAELDYLITQRRIHSIYHRNIDVPSQRIKTSDLEVRSQVIDGFLEDETWWWDFVNTDVAVDNQLVQPLPTEVNCSPKFEEKSHATPHNALAFNVPSNFSVLDKKLTALLESLPSCSACRDQRIKCSRQTESESCKECSRALRHCTMYDPILKVNVPMM